ncbi:putative histidine kinase [Helianthus annuus]|nr:putative histidine kinase [Helianthus annuus]
MYDAYVIVFQSASFSSTCDFSYNTTCDLFVYNIHLYNMRSCILTCELSSRTTRPLVYVLALPYDEVQSRMHWHIVLVSTLSSLMIVLVAILMVLTMKLARKEMCLTTALVKQKEKTQQLERKSKNQSVAFETASHDIRASLAAISGSVEISINENHQGSELATDLQIVQSSTKYLQGKHYHEPLFK